MAHSRVSRRPWLEAVTVVKEAYARERWRMSCLDRRLDGWKEVLPAWAASGIIREFGLSAIVPEDVEASGAMHDLYDWTWSIVGGVLPEVLRMACTRSPLPDAQFVEVFEVLRGQGLVFPDGTVADAAIARVSTEVTCRDMEIAVRAQDLSYRLQKHQDRQAKRKK